MVGHRIGLERELPEPVTTVAPPAAEPQPVPEPDPLATTPSLSAAEIDALLEEMVAETAPPPSPPAMDPERQKRWENMTVEQRRMLRQSMFSALAKVEGLEEVGDAIREGRIDPRQFNLNPEAIADRMEFYADTMDQPAMEAEVTRTLQSVVDQARQQMK